MFYYCCFDNADNDLFDEEVNMVAGCIEEDPWFDYNDFEPVAGSWFQNQIQDTTVSYRLLGEGTNDGCVDAGDSGSSLDATDIFGNGRIQGDVDIGAHELR